MYNNYKNFSWTCKLNTLLNISNGLKRIHQKQTFHRDLHTGNILFNIKGIDIFSNKILSISDMGLCGEVDNTDDTKIYGVMPYIAPEVLRGKPYTQAADIYSFGMIMYFAATGKQPFSDRAHDEALALKICKGNRPEINEPEAPKCYIELMKRCWDSDPDNRPSAIEVDKLINSFYMSYYMNNEIQKQFKEAEEFRQANPSSIKDGRSYTHPQAIYTSRLLNPFTDGLQKDDHSECLNCKI